MKEIKEYLPAKGFKPWARKSPILAGIFVLILYYVFELVFYLPDIIIREANGLPMEEHTGTPYDFFVEGLGILFPLVIVLIFGYMWIYKKGGFRKSFMLAIVPFAYNAFIMIGTCVEGGYPAETLVTDPVRILVGIVLFFGIGFREESVFRGVITNGIGRKYAKDRKGVWFTAIISGIFFGALHIGNVLAGVPMDATFIQVAGCFLSGVMLAAVYLRGGSIWLLILLHAFADLPGLFEVYFTNAGITDTEVIGGMQIFSLVLPAVDLIVAIFLLRKSKIGEVIENMQSIKTVTKGSIAA